MRNIVSGCEFIASLLRFLDDKGSSMKNFLLLCSLVLPLLFSGCVVPPNPLNSIEKGMTKAQVISIAGQPIGTAQVADRQFLDYNFQRPLNDGWGGYALVPHYIVLEDGAVSEWGPKDQVRPPSSTTSNENLHVQGQDAY